jgi:60 kDa SS-A/Ro ribonucleoprotein
MSKKTYNTVMNTRAVNIATPQNQPIPGREKEMSKNNAGGYTFVVDMWTMLDRFLILGSDAPTYYVGALKLTQDNAQNVVACIKADGARTVNRIVEISEAGRAPKNDPALFALALVFTVGDDEARRLAADVLPRVARIGTHMFQLAGYLKGMRGWGRAIRRGFASWYNGKQPLDLAHQMVKYANREGWTHRDVLRMAHVIPATPTHDALFTDAVDKAKAVEIDTDVAEFMAAVQELKALDPNAPAGTSGRRAAKLITDFRLPREVVPTELLNVQLVWEALLPHMGITALVRNLATMTRVGLIGGAFSEGSKAAIDKLTNEEAVKKSRIHPLQVLVALNTYNMGHGIRGSNTWNVDKKIVDALNTMFYMAFHNIVPTGKPTLLALDISGSMSGGEINGMPGITPRIATAAMAMVTARTEPEYHFIGFSNQIIELKITDKMSLEDVIKYISNRPFGGTDCAQPMLWADQHGHKIDNFAVYTDNETWAGRIQPSQALKQYRQNRGVDARLVVVGTDASPFTIADPTDPGMLDVVGFDTAAPSIMADFFRGEL